jgi:CDP-diacylglycerol pyrophosphatase
MAALGVIRLLAADPDALWKVVHDRCVPGQLQRNDPTPCALVDLRDGVARGYAVLKDNDPTKAFEYLLIPSARISGIEDPAAVAPEAVGYFAAAWAARAEVESRAGRRLADEDIGLAVNSKPGRTQNQLHIHVGCLRPEVRDALRRHAAGIGPTWTLLSEPLAGHVYRVMRIVRSNQPGVNPFRLVADGLPGAREDMKDETVVVTGATAHEGNVGLYVLESRAEASQRPPFLGGPGRGEELLDHGCAAAKGG